MSRTTMYNVKIRPFLTITCSAIMCCCLTRTAAFAPDSPSSHSTSSRVSLYQFPQIHYQSTTAASTAASASSAHYVSSSPQKSLVQLSAFNSGEDEFGYDTQDFGQLQQQNSGQFNQQSMGSNMNSMNSNMNNMNNMNMNNDMNMNSQQQFNNQFDSNAAGANFMNDNGILATGAGGDADVEGRVFQLLDEINDFCQGTNRFWRGLVPSVMRDALETRPAGSAATDPLSKLRAGPELPGIPRPVWLVMLGSFPTAFNWYGYYKFVVEEELYQYELQRTGRATTCGGYGTLVPFLYGVFIGLPLSLQDVPGGQFILQSAVVWLLLGQMNQYRRVNELCQEARVVLGLEGDGRMLHEWWACLPPPFNVLVGLRSIYFLSEYWRVARGEPIAKDYIAEDIFPSVGERYRYGIKEFLREPSRWYWFSRNIRFPTPSYLQDDDDRFEPRNF